MHCISSVFSVFSHETNLSPEKRIPEHGGAEVAMAITLLQKAKAKLSAVYAEPALLQELETQVEVVLAALCEEALHQGA